MVVSSIYDLIVLIVGLQLRENIVGVPAGQVAETRIDPHVLPSEDRPIGTLKLHLNGLGLVGDAAALISTHSAVFWPVGLLADAAGYGEVLKHRLTVDVEALLSWPKMFDNVCLAGSHVAQPGLFLHLTLCVIIGDSQRYSSSTGL